MVILDRQYGLIVPKKAELHLVWQKLSMCGNESDDGDEHVAGRGRAFSPGPGMRTVRTDAHPQGTCSMSKK